MSRNGQTRCLTMTPCVGIWWPYDLLSERTGEEEPSALASARDLCGQCPVMVACLKAHEGEPWARAVLGRDHFDAPTTHARQYVPRKVRPRGDGFQAVEAGRTTQLRKAS